MTDEMNARTFIECVLLDGIFMLCLRSTGNLSLLNILILLFPWPLHTLLGLCNFSMDFVHLTFCIRAGIILETFLKDDFSDQYFPNIFAAISSVLSCTPGAVILNSSRYVAAWMILIELILAISPTVGRTAQLVVPAIISVMSSCIKLTFVDLCLLNCIMIIVFINILYLDVVKKSAIPFSLHQSLLVCEFGIAVLFCAATAATAGVLIAHKTSYPALIHYIMAACFITIISFARQVITQILATDPLIWVLRFLLLDSQYRLGLCCYWVTFIGLSIPAVLAAKDKLWPKICLRKIFHGLAMVLFAPPLLDPKLFAFLVIMHIRLHVYKLLTQ